MVVRGGELLPETRAVIAALADPWPATSRRPDVVTFVPGDWGDLPLAEWLARARAVPRDEIEVAQ